MKLSIEDRILLFGLFPQKGNYELLLAFKELEPIVRFSEKETREFDINQTQDPASGQSHVSFNKEVADSVEEESLKDIKFPTRAHSYLVEKLQEMSDNGELTYQQMSLYKKIVLGKSDVHKSSKSSKGGNG